MIGAVLGRDRRSARWCLVGATGLVASSLLSVIVAGSGVASAATRDFDQSFGTAGIAQYSTGTGAAATGVAVVPPGLAAAGDIVVSTDGGSASQFEVSRFTPSGSIDPSFGTNGLRDAFSGQANAVAVVPPGIAGAGNIVAVGDDTSSPTSCGGQQPVVELLTPTASTMRDIPCPANFFGGALNAVTLDQSGNIVVAGQVFSGDGTLESLVARLTPAGALDTTFGSGGVVVAALGTANSAAMGVGVWQSGRDIYNIYTAGYSYQLTGSPPTATEFLTVADFTATGSRNSSFGTSGVLTPAQNGSGDAIAVMPHGKLVVAGQVASQSFLAQYTPAGGTTSFNPPSLGPISEARALAYQPEGGVLVVGGTVGSGSSQSTVVAQVDSVTGTPNALFNSGSALAIPFPSGPSSLAAVAVQPDGKAVGAGDAPTVNASPEIGLVRVQVPAPRPYSPITPTRACDTRAGTGTQCTGHTIAANTSLTVQIAGRFGVPVSATAVVVNVTAVNPANPGYLTVYPAGPTPPGASNLNVTTGQVVANLVEVALSGGALSVYASMNTDVVVDVEGYAAPAAINGPGSGLYNALPSTTRVCDTRNGNQSNLSGVAAQCNNSRIPGGGIQKVQIAGNFGVPAGATAVVANLTVVNPSAGGFITAYPDGSPTPTASNVNYATPGQVIPNRVIVPLGSNGVVDLFSFSSTDALLDISGYYTAAGGSGTGFVPEASPVRVCDTRPGSGLVGPAAQCNGKTLGPGAVRPLALAGQFAVPSTAQAAVVNVTAVNPSVAGTYLTVYPSGPPPGSSDLNPPKGSVEPNLVVAALSPSGTINVFNLAGTVDLIVDLAGYYTAPGAGS